MIENENEACQWKYERINSEGKEFVKCSICGKIKRKDIPDVQQCAGSEDSYKIQLKKMFAGDILEKEIQQIENNKKK